MTEKTRYQIGQELYVISFIYPNRSSISQPLMGWERDIPVDVKFKKLTVTEHHKVRGEFEEELKYDGFILKDDGDDKFTNQYPVASYGQISDKGDRVFRLKPKDKESYKDLFINETKRPYEYILIEEVYGPIYKFLINEKPEGFEDLEVSLKGIKEMMDKKFEEAFPGFKLEAKPFTIGKIVLNGTYKVDVVKV